MMESRWYIPHGRTLTNTKIADRGHALHITQSNWDHITGHLNRKKLAEEALEKEKEHVRKIKEGSEAMTKNWGNSVDNMRLRQEEAREKRLHQKDNSVMKAYNELRKEQEAEREKYVAKVRRSMYMKEAYPKELNTALIQSEVVFERDRQLEFNEMLDKQKKEEDAKWAKIIREQAAEEIKEKEEKRKEIRKKQEDDRVFYLKQVVEKEESEDGMNKERIEREKEDAQNMAEDMKALELFAQKEKRDANEKARREMKAFRETQAEAKRQRKIEEKEIDDIIAIHAEAKRKIDCMIKAQIERIRKEKIEARLAMQDVIYKQQMALMAKEEEVIQNAMDQKEKLLQEKERERKEYEKRMQKEMAADREAHLRQKENEELEEREMEKWAMLNRVKQHEVMQKYNAQKRVEEAKKILEYRRVLEEQMAEREEMEKGKHSVKAETAEFFKNKVAKEDQSFFEYAKEVLEHANSRGRITYPIEEVIRKYKRENRLELREVKLCEELFAQCKEAKNEKLAKTVPGKRAHYPQTDPTYRRCKCHKEKLFK